ncbi:MAG: carbon-nitrogen hydrolase [Candidatus Hydrogenedentes bacterium]|nr:carbon-nitrogen hydrolase [Candidatus Hydrogenedentota bacterium]
MPAPPKHYTVGLLQFQVSPSPEENTRKALDWFEKAAKQGAQVVCLPELYRSQYFCQKEDVDLFDLAEPIPNPSIEAFQKAAARLNAAVAVPVFERRAAGVYHNSLVMIDADGTLLGIYRKMHIPDDPAYYEKYYFAPGDLGFKNFDTQYGRVGTLICWDQWYPEGARLTALRGASILFYPTAIGWHPYEKEQYGAAQRDAWITVQRGHAIANGIYVGAVNRVGFEQPVPEQAGIEFWGSSFIADPQGVIIAEAKTDQEEVLLATVDLAHLETIRRNWPFMRDRRIDAYEDITRRFIDEG